MYAVIETGGKQYKVSEGDVIFIEKLDAEAGAAVTFDKVLAVGEGADIKVGAPSVAGASVEASVVKNGKSKKIVVFKMKPKKGYRKKQGHRQPYTKVEIKKINGYLTFTISLSGQYTGHIRTVSAELNTAVIPSPKDLAQRRATVSSLLPVIFLFVREAQKSTPVLT